MPAGDRVQISLGSAQIEYLSFFSLFLCVWKFGGLKEEEEGEEEEEMLWGCCGVVLLPPSAQRGRLKPPTALRTSQRESERVGEREKLLRGSDGREIKRDRPLGACGPGSLGCTVRN